MNDAARGTVLSARQIRPGPEVDAAIRLADIESDPRLPLSDLPAIRTKRGAVGPVCAVRWSQGLVLLAQGER